MRSSLLVVACSLLVSSACSTAPVSLPDLALVDGGMIGLDLSMVDAAFADAGALDGGVDLSGDDAGMLEGFGVIAGPCFQLDTELTEAAPSLFTNRLDFLADAFDDPEERPLLTAGAQEILVEGTAGGSSGLSEAFAFEVLARCEGATLVKSETEIVYDTAGALTDMSVSIDGEPIGVSVTRAFVFPTSDPYTADLATDLLSRKLADILESSANVSAADSWTKQILAVVAYADMHAESIATAWAAIDPGVRADTIVYVIITDGADAPLY